MNHRRLIVSCLGLLALPLAAHAELGGATSTVTADQVKMKAALASTARSGYTTHTITNSDGLIVHEYASSSGTVFAVAWNGPYKPNLQQLLGSYFSTYTTAAEEARQTRGRSLSQFHSSQSSLVIHEGGRMRAFLGFAYVPALVPSGINVNQLQ